MKTRLVALSLFLYFFALQAQQPAYYVLGENHLKGLKVFDIIQDLEQNYYFATNEGIIKYDYIQYSKIDVKSAKSVSFFNLTINKKGNIYFNNLNNQIFEINKGKCRLFYELTGTQNANLIHLTNDEKGNLMIGCRGLIVLDSNAKVIVQKVAKSIYNTSYQFNANTWLFPTSTDSVLVYSNLAIYEKKVVFSGNNAPSYKLLQFFDYNDSTYAVDLLSKKVFIFNKLNLKLTSLASNDFFKSSTNARIYITGSAIWSPSSISGINYSDSGINKSYQNFYQDAFISDVFQDQEGNILLGTFDKGVLVIPDVKIPDVISPFATDPMISIYGEQKGVVYMGSNKGQLYLYENKTQKTLTTNNKKPIEGIYGFSQSDYLIFDDEKIKCYNKKDKKMFSISSASLKDVAFVSANEMYLGTNIGILKVRITRYNQYKITEPLKQKSRIYSLAYNQTNKILYSSGADGFFAIDSNGNERKIMHRGKDLFPEKIVFHGNYIYGISRELGLLKMDVYNQIKIIVPKLPNQEENIRNIAIYKNSIIISTSNGLYQLNQDGEITYQFHTAYGFGSKKVYNFSIAGNDMWVSHLGGVQKIDLSDNQFEEQIPKIEIQSIKVNDSFIAFHQNNHFNSTQRKINFVIYSPTLRNLENIKFHYRLIGYEEAWQVQSAKNNNITYNALLPGKYTLVVKAEIFGKFSEEKSYTFTISKPFYAQWWFLFIVISLFLFIVYLIYKGQLNSQKQKSRQANELNLSKLTAIQSQMNPHFIFNSLNSIQDLVLQQNATKAYDSIGKFALLIRKIMHHSEKEFIDIEEELSILNVYLEMEMLRIKRDFHYTISSNGLNDIEIPPMLIQPFIENAIKHGLMHKKGEKKLDINMYLKDNSFVCEITDNGIGRKRTQEIQERQQKSHESFSGNTLKRRLEILKKQFGGDFGVETIDLFDENQVALGTKVILHAPFKSKF